MSPMSPRLLRPTTSIHPEAADWQNRVIANGGSVSGSTLRAVSQFCRRIDAAGIRDRFYRLNLVAGDNLAAALVPLYRGPTSGGTTYGNATDTNVNFVSGDYSEANGLIGAFSPVKYLRTGLAPDDVGVSDGHLCLVTRGEAASASAQRLAIGCQNAAGTERYSLLTTSRNNFFLDGVNDFYARGHWGGTGAVNYQQTGDATRPGGVYVLTRTSVTRADFYLNGTSVANSTGTATPGATDQEFYVHGTNGGGTPANGGTTTLRGYSIGRAVTAQQAADHYAAMQAFQIALDRGF